MALPVEEIFRKGFIRGIQVRVWGVWGVQVEGLAVKKGFGQA